MRLGRIHGGKIQLPNNKFTIYNLKFTKAATFLLALFLSLSFLPSIAFAGAPNDYGRNYGLLVHQKNQDQVVPRVKALQVMLQFFPRALDFSLDIKNDEAICNLSFIDCDGGFYPYQSISQYDFLLWFHQLSRLNENKKISDESANELYTELWLNARRNNWLENGDITYKTLHEFLYRYEVSRLFDGIQYFEGLVLDVDEINTSNFNDIYYITAYQSDIFEQILKFKAIKNRSKKENDILERLNEYYQRFKDLETEIKIQRHPFNRIKNLPGYMKENIKRHDLNEVLAEVSYDYSHNIENRKHNLILGVSKLSGKVIQSGEVIDFMDVLSDKNWWDYKYSYVIVEGDDKWLIGGGLCGSATMIFKPSWEAGLQVIKRYPHSIYYRSLYPENSVGLDATIYRFSHKNLKIRNNTESPIIYYAENDTENQILKVYIIGNSPYKRVWIEGPIQVNRSTYKWIRHMEKEGEIVNTEELVSKYGAVY